MPGTNLQSSVTSTLNAELVDASGLMLMGTCTGTPPTTASVFVHGCLLTRTDTSTGSTALYENVGSTAVPSWNLVANVNPSEIIISDGQSFLDSNGNNELTFGVVASAVNTLKISNSATGDDVPLVVVGDTAVSGLTIAGKAGGAAGVLGGKVAISGGVGNTTGAGGAVSVTGGVGGVSGAGGAASLIAGAAGTGSANAAGGQANVTAGAGQGTSAGGAVVVTSGAAENGTAVSPGASGAISLIVGAAGTATTGTAGAGGAIAITGVAGGASTGASSVAGAGSDLSATAGAGGASSGGGDTGGRGGNVVITSGAAGSGATAGIAGAVFLRGPVSRKMISTTATDTTTLSMAQILSGTVRCTPTAAANYTMPTGAVIAAALPAAFTTGDTIDFSLCNVATNDSFDITLVTAISGTTLFGNLIVEANSAAAKWSSGIFRIECTGASTYNVIRVA